MNFRGSVSKKRIHLYFTNINKTPYGLKPSFVVSSPLPPTDCAQLMSQPHEWLRNAGRVDRQKPQKPKNEDRQTNSDFYDYLIDKRNNTCSASEVNHCFPSASNVFIES